MGKGDARYKDRQQCSDREMEIRWKLAFDKLTPKEIAELSQELACITQR